METSSTAAAAGRAPPPLAERPLVVVTGGGSGIGRALVLHFASDPSVRRVVTCGRRAEALEATRSASPRGDVITAVACDISSEEGRRELLAAVPEDLPLRLLVHNAAIGDPAPLESLAVGHFEDSLRVNVVAPLALTQALLPRLRGGGRVLHLGTSVAHTPQRATTTYGVTKAAFFRLFQQLNAEGLGVPCASLSPGLVDTEGVRDHLAKARALDLPHVAFFDRAFEAGWTTPEAELMAFVDHLLGLDEESFASHEWRFSEWRRRAAAAEAPGRRRAAVVLGLVLSHAAVAAAAALVVAGAARRGRL